MNEPESNFEPLRKLLALKQHETPPPGYFNNFSSQVVSRIRHGETARKSEGMLGSLFAEAPWLLKFIQIFEAKPAYAGVFASGLCLLLVAGIVYTDHPDATPDSLMPAQTAQASSGGSSLAGMSSGLFDQGASQSDLVSSTNPVLSLQPIGTTFASQNSLFQPVSFTH